MFLPIHADEATNQFNGPKFLYWFSACSVSRSDTLLGQGGVVPEGDALDGNKTRSAQQPHPQLRCEVTNVEVPLKSRLVWKSRIPYSCPSKSSAANATSNRSRWISSREGEACLDGLTVRQMNINHDRLRYVQSRTKFKPPGLSVP